MSHWLSAAVAKKLHFNEERKHYMVSQPSHIRYSPTTTQPLAKGFVRLRPKAPPHGASANTPYPFAQVFAPPPHCRRGLCDVSVSLVLCHRDPVDTQPPSKTEGEHPPQRKHKGGRAEARPPPRQWSPYTTSYVALPPNVNTRTAPFSHGGAGRSSTAVSAPSK